MNRKPAEVLDEEYLHGVPEWELRQSVSDFVEQIRSKITGYVLINKSQTGMDRAEAISAMTQVCDELEEKVYAQLENELFSFIRQV